ncbi:DUF4350 domain-containing protein [Pontibacter sp. 13R65]|uniref:DUF4350 domain-containing protein n=1 Tax=Pontibacter sp. 13R65 TaxID=3127458 RepID=UPI00301D6CE4
MKGYRRYIALIMLLFGALVLLEYFRPKPVDWTQSYATHDKIPFGTYALHTLLPDLFPEQPVQVVREPIFNHLQDSSLTGNYIFINEYFDADSLDVNMLLDFVHRGNQVFIAAEWIDGLLADTLHLSTESHDSMVPDTTALMFTGLSDEKAYSYPANHYAYYLTVPDSLPYEPLGRNKAGKLNFLRMNFGAGAFYISSVPLAFTNYELLTLNEPNYAATALSHLPLQPVYWDEYQKLGRQEEESVFRVLLAHEPLRWAYYIGLFTVALFVFFKSKRTQRVIPVLEPPRNTTLDFVQVMGNLYFNNGHHKNIAEKKITYFLEYLRTHYHLATNEWNEELRERVVAKAGVEAQLINQLFNLIESIWSSKAISEQILMELNNNLENFYRQTQAKPTKAEKNAWKKKY